jgi:hypothetical protein
MATAPIPPIPQQKGDASGSSASPASQLKVDAGQVEIDDKLSFEVEIACHQELHLLAKEVRRHLDAFLQGTGRAQLFFLDNALRTALEISMVVQIQLVNLKQAYQGAADTANTGLVAPPAPAARRTRTFTAMTELAAPAGVADAAVALLGALRTDSRFFGRQVVIPEQAFALVLAHEWEGHSNTDFHYPTLFVPPTTARSSLLKDFVQALDSALEERKLAAQSISKLLAQTSRMQPTDPQFPDSKASLDSARDQFQAAESVFADLSNKLSRADEKTGLTQLQLLERAAFVRSIADQAKGRTFYLFAQVVSAGGAFRVKRNLLRTLFWGNAVSHAGGCLVTYGLFDDSGKLLASNTIGSRSDYINSVTKLKVE